MQLQPDRQTEPSRGSEFGNKNVCDRRRIEAVDYLEAIEGAFGADVDYAMLVKMYEPTLESAKGRYSPAECIGAKKMRIEGNPDFDHVSSSSGERSNLSVSNAHPPVHPPDKRLL